jgi:glutamate racemase
MTVDTSFDPLRSLTAALERAGEVKPLRRNSAPIGVFDSGVGGLTVLRALRAQLPNESFIYLGDTARLPYGTKSKDSVLRYSLQATEFLVSRGVKYLVIACNTASAVAVDDLRARFAPMPVIGVVEPGAAAGCRATKSGGIAVIATEGTVRGGAYQRCIARLRPDATVVAKACSLFVSLAEEGWTEGPIVESIAHRYLDELSESEPRIDTLLLGCTHFPVLIESLRKVVGPDITIVDSAETTALELTVQLRAADLVSNATTARVFLLATDGPERFARVGSQFLGEKVEASDVELVDLGALANANSISAAQ